VRTILVVIVRFVWLDELYVQKLDNATLSFQLAEEYRRFWPLSRLRS
jgi:hypothetical protein